MKPILKEKTISPESVCVHSDKVVSRDIKGKLVIVPIASGIGNREDETYALNETGRAIWERLDGKRTLAAVAADLAAGYAAPEDKIVRDVLEFASELVKQKIIVPRE